MDAGKEDPLDPFIPVEISSLAVKYSIPWIFAASAFSTLYGQNILGNMQLIVFFVSRLHWSYITPDGVVRHIDISCAILTLLYATFVSAYYYPKLAYIWYRSLGISIIVFILNEFTLYLMLQYYPIVPYMYYQSVIVHMIFLHILPVVSSIYCIGMHPTHPT